jgi:hypothetical protein
MNQKLAKKTRQLFRRRYRKTADDLANIHGQWIRPKPRWIPMFIYIKIISLFIKIKE